MIKLMPEVGFAPTLENRMSASAKYTRFAFAAAFLQCAVPVFAAGAERLSAETSNPTNNCFGLNSDARMTLSASGYAPGVEATGAIVVLDAWDGEVSRTPFRFTPGDDGEWRGAFPLPTDRYGFRRIRVATDSGTTLPKRGSAPAGTLSYAVLHAPEERRFVAEEDCFFGLFRDGYGISRWLGMHHIYGHGSPSPGGRKPPADGWIEYGTVIPGDSRFLNAFATEEERATLKSRFEDRREAFVACRTEEGRRHYAAALERFAAAAREQYPHRRIYEPFLEPELYAKPEEIAATAKIAHDAIKAGDPAAIVTFADICVVTDISTHRRLFELGIAKYMDAFALHPYSPYPPEPSGFLRNLRTLSAMADKAAGRKLRKFATEAGFSAPASKELLQMNGLVRKQLILLGEGWDFSYVFYPHDYAGDRGDCLDGDFGVFYNLDQENPPPGKKPSAESRWHIAHVGPRPAAAALSAASWYLDGFRPVACFDDLGGTALGYAYADHGGKVVIALWDYGAGCEVEIPVGRERIAVADIMGEERVEECPGGILRLALGESPVYILDPDPALWGRGVTERPRIVRHGADDNAPVRVTDIAPTFDGAAFGVAVTLENTTDATRAVDVRVSAGGGPYAPSRTAAAEIRAHGRATVALSGAGLPAPDPFRPFPVTAEAFLPGGAGGPPASFLTLPLNFLAAEYVPGLAADGTFAAWSAPHRFDAGGGLQIAFAWNETFFALDALVEDETVLNDRTGWDTWNGDSLQIALAGAVLRESTANTMRDIATEAYTENTLALTRRGPELCRTVTFDPALLPAGHGDAGLISSADAPRTVEVLAAGEPSADVAARNTPPSPSGASPLSEGGKTGETPPSERGVARSAGGSTPCGAIRYRVAFPWRFLGRDAAEVQAGDSAFLALCVNDRDAPSGPLAQRHVFIFKDAAPKGFSRVLLAPSPPPPPNLHPLTTSH